MFERPLAFLFRVVSRTITTTYRVIPVFGRLRGAIAIIRRGDGFVMVERNDGYGIAFPGGQCHRKEEPVETLWREVEEETGLRISSSVLLFRYEDDALYPALTFVFEADAGGRLRGSWEGEPVVVTLDEIRQRIMPSQTRVVEWLEQQQRRAPVNSALGSNARS